MYCVMIILSLFLSSFILVISWTIFFMEKDTESRDFIRLKAEIVPSWFKRIGRAHMWMSISSKQVLIRMSLNHEI
jgi:hypothetical protein